ncbi:ABC transporter substrate-binding protein [Arthrobacter cavernae]|uniref:ABC transporter substrate-binding protein n=1 Tax=Arthrobacter cavernae TaxID=2817681 RepID=A0A939HK40_9MICC|nr:ABC transporter substrate-binding protein [Arthrobacter cavernae]MBO1268865.1 ABC transporter substrate-binding protein [Arthrobacter cavernae]
MPLRSRSASTIAALGLAAALALTSCTNASETAPAGPAASGGAAAAFDPTTVAKDDALAEMVPAAIRSKGTLTFGSDTTYAPAEFLGPDGQTAVGYDVDLAKAIAAKLGLKAQVQTAEFAGILPSLGPKFDLGISSFTVNPERLKAVNMVSYFNAGVLWAVQKGNPKNISLDDLCGKTVGVQTGTIQENPDVSGRSKACVDAGKPAINVVSLKNQADVTTRLVNGGIDVMAADSPIIGYALSQTGDQLQTLGEVYDAAPQGITVAKSDTALAELVTKTMNSLIADGSYTKILKSWNNTEGAVTKSELNPAVSQ